MTRAGILSEKCLRERFRSRRFDADADATQRFSGHTKLTACDRWQQSEVENSSYQQHSEMRMEYSTGDGLDA